MGILKQLIGELKGQLGLVTIYGEAGSGKSLLCMLSCIEKANTQKIIYIDPQGNFSAERIKQLSPSNYEQILKNILIIRPKTFEEQEGLLNQLRKSKFSLGLLIIDPISFFYRLEFAKGEKDAYIINRNLGVQLTYLNEISRRKDIAIIITAETHSNPNGNQDASMVGGNVLDYMSNFIIELRKFDKKKKIAVLKKPKDI